MTLRPTNVYRRLGEEFAYSVDTQLDAAAVCRAMKAAEGDETVWTAVLPLGPEFEPSDVSVRLDDAGVFWVEAEAASRWQAGDFTRLRRRIQLPTEQVDVASTRCWIEEDMLAVQADRQPPKPAAEHSRKASERRNKFAVWPKSSLSDSHQRQGCVVKDNSGSHASVKGHRAPSVSKWTLDLALPEFTPEEVTVTRAPDHPGRLVVAGKHSWQGHDVVDSALAHEYRREVQPPTGVQLDRLETRFIANGVLRLEAPAQGLKPRRGVSAVGVIGGASGGAGAKLATLTRELRQHVAGGSSSGGASATSHPAPASSASLPHDNGATSEHSKKCVVQ